MRYNYGKTVANFYNYNIENNYEIIKICNYYYYIIKIYNIVDYY